MAIQSKKTNPEWDNFTDAMRKVVSVPRSKIQEHLEKEKEAKKFKRSRKSRYAAFREANKD